MTGSHSLLVGNTGREAAEQPAGFFLKKTTHLEIASFVLWAPYIPQGRRSTQINLYRGACGYYRFKHGHVMLMEI